MFINSDTLFLTILVMIMIRYVTTPEKSIIVKN